MSVFWICDNVIERFNLNGKVTDVIVHFSEIMDHRHRQFIYFKSGISQLFSNNKSGRPKPVRRARIFQLKADIKT